MDRERPGTRKGAFLVRGRRRSADAAGDGFVGSSLRVAADPREHRGRPERDRVACESLDDADPTASFPSDRDAAPPRSRRAGPREVLSAGTVIADRYRIVALLGRGGMGEVYRADDLVLGQPVALKFLPADLSTDPVRLEHFRQEVRLTRGVSHPNVCRVYDIGQADGRHFLAMEYIDGEDLSALIRRIGRLPNEKAIEIARQICAGLAAAHDQGVIHRDLKPANIMIDGRGRARITDFGVAALSEDLAAQPGNIAGTPAYMAPEQFDGRGVTRRSDIYALGLVLYEVFTGRAVFAANTLAELRDLRSSKAPPTSPSSLVSEIDPVAERVVLRCLEPDPADRPANAMAVLAALPGGDPLRAMIEAGETPSPELVAASGARGALSSRVAAMLAAVALAGFAIAFILLSRLPVHELAGGLLPPDVLEYRAKEILNDLGYEQAPADTAQGYAHRGWGQGSGTLDDLRRTLAEDVPGVYLFWYRQHTRELEPLRSTLPGGRSGERVSRTDPPVDQPGMISMDLSPRGKLVLFHAVTPAYPKRAESDEAVEPDWQDIITIAGLSEYDLKEVPPGRFPRAAWSERRAWTGVGPEAGARPIRVEAASLDGRLISFAVLAEVDAAPAELSSSRQSGEELVNKGLVLLSIFGGGFLAIRNLRLGRGDRRGAIRLAVCFLSLSMLGWVIDTSHSTVPAQEAALLISGIGYSIYRTLLACTLYIGLEPFIRKQLPTALVSWSRLLAGKWKDPIVGRDVLVGLAVGGVVWAALTVAGTAAGLNGLLLGTKLPEPNAMLGFYFRMPVISTGRALAFMVFFVLINALCRKPRWLAPAVLASIIAALLFASYGAGTNTIYLAVIILVGAGSLTLVIYRFGLLTLVLMVATQQAFSMTAFTLDVSVWYAAPTVVLCVVIVALTLYGVIVSTGCMSESASGRSTLAPATGAEH